MDEAVLVVMNTMKTKKEMQCDLYMSSWDIKRAFDKVPMQLFIFAWMRLDDPPGVAEYLVNIDRGGTHRTPTGGYDTTGRAAMIAWRFCASLHNSALARAL